MSFHDEYSSFKPPSIVLAVSALQKWEKGGKKPPNFDGLKVERYLHKGGYSFVSFFKEMKAHGVGAPVQPYEVLSTHRKTVKRKSPWVHK